MQFLITTKDIIVKKSRILYYKIKILSKLKNGVTLSRASPFVEEAVLILIALFFFVILFTAFQNILNQIMDIVKNIFQNSIKL